MGEREFAVVDTHCHIGLHKYEPVEVLIFHMERAGVDQAVFIQYLGNSDNSYIVETMEAHPGRFAAAMIVDDEDDGSAIRSWAEQGLGGIRLLADFRGRGGDPLAHWRTSNELGLVVSVFSRPDILQSAEFNEVLRLFPDLSMVIEHLGGVKPGVDLDEFAAITALARHACKPRLCPTGCRSRSSCACLGRRCRWSGRRRGRVTSGLTQGRHRTFGPAG